MMQFGRSLICFLMLVCIWAPARGEDLPPRLIHYQGRLTDTQDNPITTPRDCWFSIYVGGESAGAGTGQLRYRERAVIQPSRHGIFEHAVGSGEVVIGSLASADFATSQPVYLEIAINSLNEVLLPRTRFTSSGFSFVAEDAVGHIHPRSLSIRGVGMVINEQGRWVGPAPAEAAAPQPRIIDMTGGPTVSGDLLSIEGEGLVAARVWIGGREASVIERSAERLLCQVPAGLAAGMQPVMLSAEDGTAALVAGSIMLTRYLIALSTAADRIWILDPARLEAGQSPLVAQLGPLGINPAAGAIQPAFIHHGALMLVPDGGTGMLTLDLSSHPPRLLDPLRPSSPTLTMAVAVDASPDGRLLAVADRQAGRIEILRLTATAPPYELGTLAATPETDPLLRPALPSGYLPCALRFVGDALLLALDHTQGEVAIFQRQSAVAGEVRPFSTVTQPGLKLNVGAAPHQLLISPDQRRGLTLTPAATNNFWTFGITNSGLSQVPIKASLGAGAVQLSMLPDAKTLLAVTHDGSQQADQLSLWGLGESQVLLLGRMTGPATRPGLHLRVAAAEPVVGELIAAATTECSMIFYRRTGLVLDYCDSAPLQGGEWPMGDDFLQVHLLLWQP